MHDQLIDHMSPHITKWITYAGLGFGSTSGLITWLNENAGAVGAMCSIGGIAMGLVFGIIHVRIAVKKAGLGQDNQGADR